MRDPWNLTVHVVQKRLTVSRLGVNDLKAVMRYLQAFAAGLGSAPTTVLRLDGMVKAIALLDEQERTDVRLEPLTRPRLVPRCIRVPHEVYLLKAC